jgi:hypothetical protein
MNTLKPLLAAAIVAAFLVASASVAQASLTLDLQPDDQNPAAPAMGDHLRFWSMITNAGPTPVEGLVAWISLVEIDPGNEQPVDLEDWSAHKAITGATLDPGQSLRTDWPMRLIKGGHAVFTSSTIQFHVHQKPVLQTTRVLPVVAGVPLIIIGFLIVNKVRRRHDEGQA